MAGETRRDDVGNQAPGERNSHDAKPRPGGPPTADEAGVGPGGRLKGPDPASERGADRRGAFH
ncbi:MAG: hypothetical protein ACK41C_14460 [Phenylobacterium sp.]|uniref:hypothetical protein n=1 Tax=Phenylobacterium sp. TaxID=1871053 RepID=UPI00391B2B9E